ncbi:Esterase S [Armadillidium nasatum]|uniref:Esterase S n=1 Tax=Armadillidium nasatum TaxID=96803 RepID=A0A5N5TA72_9CRUS|nr:Esterase S [Armadillidium nasatum]
MKMKFLFVVAVLGFITVTEARFPKFRLSNRRIEDPVKAAEINSKFEEAIDEKWAKHTKVEAPPVNLGKYWDDDIFNATHIGLKCPQGAYVGDEPGGDEDCLFLNVYTPYKPTTTEAKDLAVMFFIYGGSFTSGDASLYMPTKLLDHDVILVTTHYRLGAFGFYTRDSPNAPGNLAFYDMISGLTWVQNYISDFGGSYRIGNHIWRKCRICLSQLHDALTGLDLFRGVIAESGSALDHWAFDEDSTYATNYYEHYVGCDIYETEDEILDCMRKVPFQDLIHAGHAMVVHHFINENKNVIDLMQLEVLESNMRASECVVDEPLSIAKSMQESYCGDIDLADLEVAQYCLIDVCGILFLKAGSWQVSNLHSYYSKQPTYYYTLEYEADDSMGDWVVSDSSPFYTGITHADDLMYIFAMPAIMEPGPEKDVSQRMTLLWTNFARYL